MADAEHHNPRFASSSPRVSTYVKKVAMSRISCTKRFIASPSQRIAGPYYPHKKSLCFTVFVFCSDSRIRICMILFTHPKDEKAQHSTRILSSSAHSSNIFFQICTYIAMDYTYESQPFR
ncbi:hypothetical protein MPTK1_5g24180 [Marchantia polymorpha subsp. ruderalis]|uniref:Uncharacterized protein n=2 Tax=Marchantia polymorpha TaxID=3197 RepID=A0AAF6BLQ8_MARPO|nr:hypothetical protein MARPO_0010s0038 [Marchantia polymorpha]BBN12942.1 hypothetical protein Mp_5g24180 [Marchantia polymorpha subsp. ruderalis]|eukprot:PTQ46627.1 hypothetical protein MARPO_0010s0038 [Marchantia polymorpha]